MNFDESIWALCKKIPKGKVTTYKEIGKAINSKAYRAIGQALKRNPLAPDVPCHRVVSSDASLCGYNGEMNSARKIALLKSEDIIVKNYKIKDFEKHLFRF
jgi:methylated-DNA-[protein]-cysteine S-methyltransferase